MPKSEEAQEHEVYFHRYGKLLTLRENLETNVRASAFNGNKNLFQPQRGEAGGHVRDTKRA